MPAVCWHRVRGRRPDGQTGHDILLPSQNCHLMEEADSSQSPASLWWKREPGVLCVWTDTVCAVF